jgi:arylsulfatase A-like enzyme
MSIQPNVLFLLIDGLRADRVYDDGRTAITLAIDALRTRGTSFQQMVSTTSTTTPSVASLLTGLYPAAHGIRTLSGHKLANRMTLPEVFREAGYYTHAEVTGPLTTELGLDRGFDSYVYRSEDNYLDTKWGKNLYRQLSDGKFEEPWFLFLHLWELHVLWKKRWPVMRRVSRQFNSPKFGSSSYERALSQLDDQLGKLLTAIDLQNTLVLLTSDHGEAIYHSIEEEKLAWKRQGAKQIFPWSRHARTGLESQYRLLGIGHGFHIREELIRVPLLFTGHPFPQKLVVPNLARQIDIFPTLVDALALLPLNRIQIHGRSLMPLVRGDPWEDLPAYIEAIGRELPSEKEWLAGIRTSRYKLILGPNNPDVPEELYDLENDPYEEHSLTQERLDLSRQLKAQFLALCETGSGKLSLHGPKMSPEEEASVLERLQGLGYVD